MNRICLLLAILTAGCAGVKPKDPGTGLPPKRDPGLSCEHQPADIVASTWNVGIAVGVMSNSGPRTPPVLQEVAKLRNDDVICIQEMWSEDGKAAVKKALGLPEGHVYYVDTRGRNEDPTAVCDADDLKGVLRCVDKNCSNASPENVAICAYANCKPSLFFLREFHSDCARCVVASVGKSKDDIVRICTGKGASRYHDGSNGVILASKWPLKNVESVDLPASGANRVALFATIEGRGWSQPIEVACTHTTSTTDGDKPLERRFDTWAEEQVHQFKLVSDRLTNRAAGRPQIFIGDMNAGPALNPPAIKYYCREGWEAMLKLGFRFPVTEEKPPFCSICDDNLIRNAGFGGLIDLVGYRDPPGAMELEPVCSERFATERIDVVDHYGKSVRTNLSDHYGVKTRFRIK